MSFRNLLTEDWHKSWSSPVGFYTKVPWDVVIPLDGTPVGTLVGRWGKATVDGWCGKMMSLILGISEGISEVFAPSSHPTKPIPASRRPMVIWNKRKNWHIPIKFNVDKSIQIFKLKHRSNTLLKSFKILKIQFDMLLLSPSAKLFVPTTLDSAIP